MPTSTNDILAVLAALRKYMVEEADEDVSGKKTVSAGSEQG
jgi:hypothetical protein